MGKHRWTLHQTRRKISDRINCSKNPNMWPDDELCIHATIGGNNIFSFFIRIMHPFPKLVGPPQIRTSNVCLGPSSKLSKQVVVKRVSKEKSRTGQ